MQGIMGPVSEQYGHSVLLSKKKPWEILSLYIILARCDDCVKFEFNHRWIRKPILNETICQLRIFKPN